ncbi:MAG: ABC transporter substrate binding protein [Myxococcales bacterium]
MAGFLSASPKVWAADVAVVRSSDIAPYKAVEQAFTSEIPATKQLSMAVAGVDVKAGIAGANLVLAIGPDAAKAVLAAAPGVPVLVTLAAESELGAVKPAATIPMLVPPARQVKLIKAFLPAVTRIGFIFDPARTKTLAAECEAAAKAAGLTFTKVEVTSRSQVIDAARSLVTKIDALWLVPDSTVVGVDTFKVLVPTTMASGVSLIGFTEGMAKTGAVLAIEAGYAESGKRAAEAGRRILAGQPPNPEAPDGVVYVNAKSADLLKAKVSRDGAAKVFE